jgi:glycosyltransferase involved in cell wall biosynthesis
MRRKYKCGVKFSARVHAEKINATGFLKEYRVVAYAPGWQDGSYEFLKGVVAFILYTCIQVNKINATFPSPLCDLRDLSAAGVKRFFDLVRLLAVCLRVQISGEVLFPFWHNSSHMKTLFFCNLVPYKTGAFEWVLRCIGYEFKEHHDQFMVVFAGEPIPEVAESLRAVGVKWEVIPGWGDLGQPCHPWAFCLPALRILKRERPDVAVVHFGNELPSLVTAMLAHMMGLWRTRWVWQQDQQISDPTWITAKVSKIRLLGLVFNRFVATYDAGKESLLKRGIPLSRISVIYNSLRDHVPARPKGWLRAELEIGADEVILVTVGSLIPRKRIDFILRACAQLGKKGSLEIGHIGENKLEHSSLPSPSNETNAPHSLPLSPSWRLLVIGEGSERERLVALARELGIAERTHFLGLRNDVRDILAESDLMLHAALAEACTYAISESMAARIPAVVTEAGAAREQMIDGVTGWILKPDDSDGFVSKIAALICNEVARHDMGKLARERWEARYRVCLAAKSFHSLYASVYQ